MTEPMAAPSEVQHRPHEVTLGGDDFLNRMWGVEPEKKEEKIPAVETEKKTEPVQEVKEQKVETPVQTEWFKNYGWENEEKAKAEIEALKNAATKQAEVKPIEYVNEESKTVHQLLLEGKMDKVLEYYNNQDRIAKAISSDINKDNAENIIKLQMKLGNSLLSDEDVDFQYRQEYGTPKEPKQRVDETDEDFEERKGEWEERVRITEQKRVVAAKMAVPQLEKQKAQIVLPEINKPEVEQKQLSQEELDAIKAYDSAYIQSVDSSVNNFKNIAVQVKNEVVDFPVTFDVSEADKVAIGSMMKDLQAKHGYDVNAIFSDLWVNEDKTLKTQQMVEDYYWLKNKGTIINKLVNDSANKAIDGYIKSKKNINITETSTGGSVPLTEDNKSDADKLRDSFFG